MFFERALGRLRGGDRELPQILRVRDMLKRGLGVHHAGGRPPALFTPLVPPSQQGRGMQSCCRGAALEELQRCWYSACDEEPSHASPELEAEWNACCGCLLRLSA